MSEGPFTDNMLKHYLTTVQTQRGIVEYAEGMAQVLAEAGRASCKATGDAPTYAVERWSQIIKDRALAILRAEQPTPTELRKKMQKQLDDRRAKNVDA